MLAGQLFIKIFNIKNAFFLNLFLSYIQKFFYDVCKINNNFELIKNLLKNQPIQII